MNIKSVPTAFALCTALLAAGCAASSPPRQEGAAAPRAELSAQSNAAVPSPAPTDDRIVERAELPAQSKAALFGGGEDDKKVSSPLPQPTGFLNDFAEVIDAEEQADIEAKLTRLRDKTRIEFGVAVVETTGGARVEDYSLAVARGWGIGPPKGEGGGGLLLLVAIKDRVWNLQVSRALKADASMSDEASAKIAGRMDPHLRRREYGAAVSACVEGIVRHLAARRGFDAEEVLGPDVGKVEINTKD